MNARVGAVKAILKHIATLLGYLLVASKRKNKLKRMLSSRSGTSSSLIKFGTGVPNKSAINRLNAQNFRLT
jgi:hypothetical protein